MRWIIWLCVLVALVSLAPARADVTFTLEEPLGYGWETAVMRHPLTAEKPGQLRTDRGRLLCDGVPIPCQLVANTTFADGSVREGTLWFRTDLPAKGMRRFVFRAAVPPIAPDNAAPFLRRHGNILEIGNTLTAVRVPAGRWTADGPVSFAAYLVVPEGDIPGPLLGVKLPSGAWTAMSRLRDAGALRGCETEILAQGPIFIATRTTYTFAKGQYRLLTTIRAGEPLVRLDESYTLAGILTLTLDGWQPSRLTHKGQLAPAPISTDIATTLATFTGWDLYSPGYSPVITLDSGEEGDLLALLATDADWPYPGRQAMTLATRPGAGMTLSGSLADGARHWALYTGTQTMLRAGGDAALPLGKAAIAWWTQQVAFPLDKIAHWQLTWAGMETTPFPHTFMSAAEVPEIRARLQAQPEIATFMADLLGAKNDRTWREALNIQKNRVTPANQAQWDAYKATYYPKSIAPSTNVLSLASAAALYTGDDLYLRQLRDPMPGSDYTPLGYLNGFTAGMRRGMGPLDPAVTYLNASDIMLRSFIGLELLLGSPLLTPAEKRDYLTKLAFFSYVLQDAMYLPPSYPKNVPGPYPGYEIGTPNMRHCHWTNLAFVACMLGNHPLRDVWIARARAEQQRNMGWLLAENGVYQESPFYTSRDTMRAGLYHLALARIGVTPSPDELARERRGFRYLAEMLTPPDPRLGGRRAYYALGRAYTGVIDPTFMIAAHPWAADDPAFGAVMRWCWEAQGKPMPDCMGTAGGRDVAQSLLAWDVLLRQPPLTTPPLTSRRYAGMGASFRSQVGTLEESQVLFRHGDFARELSFNGESEGAVYFYGKGAPLLPRAGNISAGNSGKMTFTGPAFGNRLQFLTGDNSGRGEITACALLGDQADLATGVTRDGHWRRDVLLAKDLTATDPLYLLVRDTPSRTGAATALHWWVATAAVAPKGYEQVGVVSEKITDARWLENLGKNWAEAPRLTGQTHRLARQCGVDLDLFIATPAEPVIITDAACVEAHYLYCANPKLRENLQLIRTEQSAGQPYLTLLVPRTPAMPTPTFTTIADGRGVQIRQGDHVDYLFLSDTLIRYADGDVQFEGTAGYIRQTGAAQLRMMVQEGTARAGKITLSSQQPATVCYDGNAITVLHAPGPAPRVALTAGMPATPIQIREIAQ